MSTLPLATAAPARLVAPHQQEPAQRKILALDPGTQDVGLAVVQDGLVVAALWVQRPSAPQRCDRCPTVPSCSHATLPLMRARMVAALLDAAGPLTAYDLVVAEWPQVYTWQKAPADDLLQVAGVAASICSAAAQEGVPAWCYQPREWKGVTKKDVFQAQILACLSGAELALLPRAPQTGRYLTDPLDAVGLALYAAGRLGQWIRPWGGHLPEVEPVAAKPRRAPAKRGQQPLLPASRR